MSCTHTEIGRWARVVVVVRRQNKSCQASVETHVRREDGRRVCHAVHGRGVGPFLRAICRMKRCKHQVGMGFLRKELCLCVSMKTEFLFLFGGGGRVETGASPPPPKNKNRTVSSSDFLPYHNPRCCSVYSRQRTGSSSA